MMLSSVAFVVVIASGSHGQAARATDALLTDLERRAVRFFWEQSNPENGFTKDRATNADVVDTHDVASCASVGFALVAYAIGAKHGWIPREDALKRTRVTLENLTTKWPNARGWLYHFVNWKTGERVWNCEASSIDTSICLAGVLSADEYWQDNEVGVYADLFTARIDWKWMLTNGGDKPNEKHLSMGWHPSKEKGQEKNWSEGKFIDARWNDYNECKMLYIQGLGRGVVPPEAWDTIKRTPVRFHDLDLLTGGPLFMHQMSESFYDFRNMRDRLGFDYGVETRNATLGNRQYCIDNPKGYKSFGENFWGLSACDCPEGYDAFGAPGWINDRGVITPTSAVASLPFTPAESTAFAVAMRRDHPDAFGKYGFPNGYAPDRNWKGPDVIGIDLGMMMCGIENARTGFVWKLSAKDGDIRKGFRLAGLRPAKPEPRLRVSSEQ